MLLRSIRSRLLALVLATVVPFVTLVGAGLWSQWREDQAAAIERALSEARLLAAQLDDQIGNFQNLLVGLSPAVSTDPADASVNDALFRKIKSKLPDFVGNVLLYSLDGSNIGTSSTAAIDRPHANDRAFFQDILAGRPFSVGEVVRTHQTGEWLVAISYPVADQEGRRQAAAGGRVRGLSEGGTVCLPARGLRRAAAPSQHGPATKRGAVP